jgi:microcystin-dependent protein
MPWGGISPSQSFTRTNGTRTGATTWQEADAAGVDILSDAHDTHDQDIADGVNACIKKDGGNAATSNLPMGGFRHTNVGAASGRTNYARFSDVQDGKGIYCPTVGGTANAITLTTGYSVDAYAAGQCFSFIAASTNSDVVTVAVDGLSAKSITGPAGTALSAGQILASALTIIEYDGTRFQLLSVAAVPAAIPAGFVAAWPLASVPTGWLECDGSAVSRSSYPALFAVYGTSYGPGDGSTTFNLPNYKDYFLRGFDSSGTDAASRTDRGDGTTGASVGTKQAGDYLSHTHTGTTTSDGAPYPHLHATRPDRRFQRSSDRLRPKRSNVVHFDVDGLQRSPHSHVHNSSVSDLWWHGDQAQEHHRQMVLPGSARGCSGNRNGFHALAAPLSHRGLARARQHRWD